VLPLDVRGPAHRLGEPDAALELVDLGPPGHARPVYTCYLHFTKPDVATYVQTFIRSGEERVAALVRGRVRRVDHDVP
jgi:hypothetical protein